MPKNDEMDAMMGDGMALKGIANRLISYAKMMGAGASEEVPEEMAGDDMTEGPGEDTAESAPPLPDAGKDRKKAAIIIALGKKFGAK